MADTKPCNNCFQMAFDKALVGMVQIGLDDVIQAANATFCKTMGYEENELVGHCCNEIIHPADKPVMAKLREVLVKQDQPMQLEIRHQRKQGAPLWSTVNIRLVRNKKGKPCCFLSQVVAIDDVQLPIIEQDSQPYTQWGVVLSDINGVILEQMNPSFARMYDYRMDELIGRAMHDLVAPECREAMTEHMEHAHRQGHHSFEAVHIRKDGARFPVAVDITMVREADGEIKHSVINIQNITSRKETEKSLQHFAAIVASSDDAIIGKNLDGIITCWNPGAEKIFGYREDEVIGKSIEIMIPESHKEEERQILKRIHNDETVKNFSTVHRCKDGRLIDISVTVSPIRNNAGEIIGVTKVARDITELKQMEEELLYRENKFRTLAENSPNIIIRYDINCNRVYVNPAYAKEKGISIEEALTSPLEEYWKSSAGVTAQEVRTILQQVMADGVTRGLIVPWPSPEDGKMNIYDFQMTAEHKPDGQVIGVLAIGHNITALKQAEEELGESHARLRGLTAQLEIVREEERKRIARDLHDELGQNLTALRMGVSMVRMQQGNDNPIVQEQLRGLNRLVDKTIHVVRDIASSLRPAPLDMGVVSALEWMADKFTQRSGVKCCLELDDAEMVIGDKYSTAIFRIVQESLTNVARYAEATQVVIRFKKSADNYLLEVVDDGKGFDVTKTGMSSFGLVGIRERALMLEGSADIISSPSRGTTVRVTLPVVADEEEDNNRPQL